MMRIQNEFQEIDIKEKSSFIYSNKKGRKPAMILNLLNKFFNLYFQKGVEVSINDFELIKVIGRGAFGKVF